MEYPPLFIHIHTYTKLTHEKRVDARVTSRFAILKHHYLIPTYFSCFNIKIKKEVQIYININYY